MLFHLGKGAYNLCGRLVSWDLFLVEVHLVNHEVCPRRASFSREVRRCRKKRTECGVNIYQYF